MLYGLLIVIGLLAVLCSYLRRHAVRWLFTLLMVVFWVTFLALLGFVIGYQAGSGGVSLLKLLHIQR